MLRPRKVRTKLYIHSYEHFIHTATAALPKGAPKYKPPYVKKEKKKKTKTWRSKNSVGHNDQSNRMLASSWESDSAAAASAVCCALEIITMMVTCHQFTMLYPPPPPTPTCLWLRNRWLATIQGMECCWWSLQTCSLQPSRYHRYSQSPCLQQGNACLMILTDFHTI